MPSLTDLKYAFASINFICKVKLFPLNVDQATGKLFVNRSKWSKLISRVWQYLFVLHVVHMVTASGYVTFFSDSDSGVWKPEETPILILVCVCFTCVSQVSFKFNHVLENVVILWNFAYEFLTGQNVENKSKSKWFALQLLFLRFFPFVIYACLLAFPFFYVFKPHSKFLFIRFVELFYGTGNDNGVKINLGTYALCMMVDMVSHFYFLSFVNFFFYLLFGSLMSVKESSRKQINELRWKMMGQGNGDSHREEHHLLIRSSKVLRTLHLQVSMLNISTSAIIATFKVVILTIAIFCGFAFILLFAKGSPLAVVHIILFIHAISDYTIIFNDAHQVTSNIDELKEIIQMRTRRAFWSEKWSPSGILPKNQWVRYREWMKEKELNRVARAVPRLSIKSGDVAIFERNFTLEYNSFVTQKIVDLLLTF